MELVPAPNGWMCKNDPGEPGLGKPRWSVSLDEGKILAELFRGLEILEIGTGLGVSTREIAKKAKWIYTVDVDPWVAKNVELPENATFYNDIRTVPEGLDGAFIDGLHSRTQCVLDIEEARRIVKPGGLIALHDANMKAMQNAIVESGLDCYLILTPTGIAIGWNDKEKK